MMMMMMVMVMVMVMMAVVLDCAQRAPAPNQPDAGLTAANA